LSSRWSAESVDGLLPIYKPHGMISKDVSRWLTRRFGRLKLGHVGTLDPAASGVLPILLGRATRLQDYLLDLDKSYEFDMTLGFETDSLDLDGARIKEGPWHHVTPEALVAAGFEFVGEIEQIPPLFSAVKFRGKALYDYARSGEGDEVPIEALKRRVRVHSLDFQRYASGVATFTVSCSKGTYIRTLMKDIAEKVGSCATLTRLVRTEAAGVSLQQAMTLESIEGHSGSLEELVIPISQVRVGIPRWRSGSPIIASRLRSGQDIVLDPNEYLNGVSQGENGVLDEIARPTLLLDDKGQAFGIGTRLKNMTGQTVMQMKRGL
jgi:tRNA pseudouridine55 synthase